MIVWKGGFIMRSRAKFYFYLTEIKEPFCTTRSFENLDLLDAKIKEIDEAIESKGVIKFNAEMLDDYSLRISGKSVIYYKIEKLK